jgi:dynamin 1-like protein
LPRGQGIVTRCPLVLQLRRTQPKEQIKRQGDFANYDEEPVVRREGEEYGEFLHRKGEKFYDFAKIRKEIEDQTNRLAGNDKNITDEPISLTIFSPYVVDLTLVDLPGITKVPIKGQPHDIEEQIKRITYKYIL